MKNKPGDVRVVTGISVALEYFQCLNICPVLEGTPYLEPLG